MKFGIGLPTGMEGLINPIPFFEPEMFVEVGRRAEQLGYDSVWGNDHYAPQNYVREHHAAIPNFYEPLTVLTAVAATTTHVELGTAVLVLPMRDLVTVAKQATTIDQLSAGRLLLGVGIGAYREEYEAARPDLRGVHRGRRLEEGLELLGRLMREPTVTHNGENYRVERLELAPKGRDGAVRVLVGGHQPSSIERAVRYGAGWLPGWRPFPELREWTARLREAAAVAGRDPHALIVAPQFSCLVGDDQRATEQRYLRSGMVQHRKSLANTGRDPDLAMQHNLIGDPETILGKLEELYGMGADHLACTTFCVETPDEYLEQIEWFASAVMEPFRAAHGLVAPGSG